jgi:cell division protein FtsB
MGDKAMSHKHKLEDKRSGLERENQSLTQEIRVLERKVTLLRTDARMIEKVAKCKLGMARPDETVYMFNEKRRGARGSGQ